MSSKGGALKLVLIMNTITLVLVAYLAFRVNYPMRGGDALPTEPCVSTMIAVDKLFQGSVPATVIGKYGGRPWGNQSQFVDPAASWIWGGSNNHANWLFFVKFTNSSKTTVDMTLHLIVDQNGAAYVDGSLVLQSTERGWLTKDYSRTTISVAPGEHLLAVYAENRTETGGVLAALIPHDGATAVYTSDKWSCKKVEAI